MASRIDKAEKRAKRSDKRRAEKARWNRSTLKHHAKMLTGDIGDPQDTDIDTDNYDEA